MKFIYTPAEGMAETLTKYDYFFTEGEPVEVTDLKKASKMQRICYLSVCLETEDEAEKPKRTRRTKEQIEADKLAEENEDASE